MSRSCGLLVYANLMFFTTIIPVGGGEPQSKLITSLLREPLPSEDLCYSADNNRIIIKGPTYEYTVDKGTGTIVTLRVKREGQTVICLPEPATLVIGDYDLASKGNQGQTRIVTHSAAQIVLRTEGP